MGETNLATASGVAFCVGQSALEDKEILAMRPTEWQRLDEGDRDSAVKPPGKTCTCCLATPCRTRTTRIRVCHLSVSLQVFDSWLPAFKRFLPPSQYCPLNYAAYLHVCIHHHHHITTTTSRNPSNLNLISGHRLLGGKGGAPPEILGSRHSSSVEGFGHEATVTAILQEPVPHAAPMQPPTPLRALNQLI